MQIARMERARMPAMGGGVPDMMAPGHDERGRRATPYAIDEPRPTRTLQAQPRRRTPGAAGPRGRCFRVPLSSIAVLGKPSTVPVRYSNPNGAMRTLRDSSSVLVFWQDLVFIEAGLLAEDETKPIAALIAPVLAEFPAILQRDLDTRRGVIQASARAYVADASLDATIRRLFSAVLGLVEQNREREEFTTLFQTHIGDIVRHALNK
jgi:hypothetical protein